MPKKEVVLAVPMRVLKIETCPSLSGRSELTYHVGCNAEGDIHLRVVQNSGTGQFNADWISLSMVEQLLSEHPKDKPLSSAVLRPVFRNKSSNSPSFAFAVLLAEGLVKAGAEKGSGYLLADLEGFKKAVAELASSGTQLEPAMAMPTKAKRAAKA